MCSKNKYAFMAGLLFCLIFQTIQAETAQARGLLRDAEIEHAIREMADPIFKVAGIPPKDVRILLVNDSSINAFVAGGLNLFIHSGLIKATDNAGMLIGVIAHETGHIAGAHLSKLRDIASRATIGSVISAVLGAAAIAAGGKGDVGVGIIAGGQNIAQRQFLTDIRINEQSADHAALNYLDQLGISASGVREMFTVLRRNERGRNVDPYTLTHPLSKERIATVRNHVAQSTIPEDNWPDHLNLLHARMRAKLIGFTESYETVFRLYPEKDQSFAGRYARAIAYFKNAQLDKAINLLRDLQKDSPNDPFLYDTLGQVLFESAKPKEAEESYAQANRLFPHSALIMTDYARSLIVQNTPAKLNKAANLLEQATRIDKTHAFAWRQLATAYGKLDRLGESYLALAQESAAIGNYEEARSLIKRADPLLEPGSFAAQAARDLELEATQAIKRKKEGQDLF